MSPLHITVLGAPVTKKNHGRIVRLPNGRSIILPSKPYTRWLEPAKLQARAQWMVLAGQTLRAPCAVAATFYRKRRVGDLVNFIQALADMLEAAGVVDDDKRITCWDGSKLDADPKRPRIELLIRSLED